MKYTVGVDIGATEIRVVAVRGVDPDGRAAVSRIGRAPLREGVVSGGHIRNHVQAAQALVRALKMAGVPRYGFVLGLSAPEMAVNRLSLPGAIGPAERLSTIRTMGYQVAPNLLVEESVLDVNEIRTEVTGDGRELVTLSVVAVARDQVESLQRLMILAGCQPRAIDLSAAGLMRALVRTPSNDEMVHTVVDIGATKTTVATRQGLHLRSVRVLPIGGAAITRAIMSQTNESFEEAEKRKFLLSLGVASTSLPVILQSAYGADTMEPAAAAGPSDTLLDEALETVIEDLVNQIALSIENDATNYGNTFTQGVVLAGPTAQIPGLRDRVHQRLGVGVQLGHPWARFEKTRHNLPYLQGGADNPRPLMGLSTAIGLALWEGNK